MTLHLILTEAERLRIVNALAFYFESLGCPEPMEAERLEQFQLAMAEDHAPSVDQLADRVAGLF
jgi:hypothetical protein